MRLTQAEILEMIGVHFDAKTLNEGLRKLLQDQGVADETTVYNAPSVRKIQTLIRNKLQEQEQLKQVDLDEKVFEAFLTAALSGIASTCNGGYNVSVRGVVPYVRKVLTDAWDAKVAVWTQPGPPEFGVAEVSEKLLTKQEVEKIIHATFKRPTEPSHLGLCEALGDKLSLNARSTDTWNAPNKSKVQEQVRFALEDALNTIKMETLDATAKAAFLKEARKRIQRMCNKGFNEPVVDISSYVVEVMCGELNISVSMTEELPEAPAYEEPAAPVAVAVNPAQSVAEIKVKLDQRQPEQSPQQVAQAASVAVEQGPAFPKTQIIEAISKLFGEKTLNAALQATLDLPVRKLLPKSSEERLQSAVTTAVKRIQSGIQVFLSLELEQPGDNNLTMQAFEQKCRRAVEDLSGLDPVLKDVDIVPVITKELKDALHKMAQKAAVEVSAAPVVLSSTSASAAAGRRLPPPPPPMPAAPSAAPSVAPQCAVYSGGSAHSY